MKSKGTVLMFVGMLLVVAGILLNRYADGINDFVLGIVDGVGIALILFGLIKYSGKRQSVK
ncbi:hypothetical protein D3C76_183150 [compost metagenome]